MSDRKIINDPVFGFINIPKGLLYDIVCHPLLQRLTRIKQLGLSSAVYPGAQHTRFQHSLGAYHLMSETIKHLTAKGNFIYASEADVLNVAMFGVTAGQWREANPDSKGNIRDYATINELI